MVCDSTLKGIVNMQDHFLMINNVGGIVVQLKIFWDTICSYIIDDVMGELHVYDTFYGAVMYHILNLYVNCVILNL